jgi:hypothetical protein
VNRSCMALPTFLSTGGRWVAGATEDSLLGRNIKD